MTGAIRKLRFPGKVREYFRERLRSLGMGLENRLNDNVELFSGGQRQALTLLMTVMMITHNMAHALE